MVNELKRICGERFDMFCELIKDKEDDTYKMAMSIMNAWSTAFPYMMKQGQTKPFMPSVSPDGSKICFYNQRELRLYEIKSEKLILKLDFDEDMIQFAHICDFLVVCIDNEISFYSKNGTLLYVIDGWSDSMPKIFSSEDFIILEHKYKTYIVDPYFKLFNTIPRNLSYYLRGYNSEFNFVTLGDTLIVVNSMRKVLKDKVKTKTFAHIFKTNRKNRISRIAKRTFNKSVVNSKYLYNVSYEQQENSVILQPGTGEMINICIENNGVACGKLKLREMDGSFIGSYTHEDKKMSLFLVGDSIMYCLSVENGMKIVHTSKADGMSIAVKLIDGTLIVMTNKKVVAVDMNKFVIKAVDLPNPFESSLIAMYNIDKKLVVTSYNKNIYDIDVNAVLELENGMGEAI